MVFPLFFFCLSSSYCLTCTLIVFFIQKDRPFARKKCLVRLCYLSLQSSPFSPHFSPLPSLSFCRLFSPRPCNYFFMDICKTITLLCRSPTPPPISYQLAGSNLLLALHCCQSSLQTANAIPLLFSLSLLPVKKYPSRRIHSPGVVFRRMHCIHRF